MSTDLVRPLFPKSSATDAALRSAVRITLASYNSTDPTYTFGFDGKLPFTSASPETAALDTLIDRYITCVSGGDPSVLLCSGVIGNAFLYTTTNLALGLTGAAVVADGYVGGGAGEELNATLPEDVPAGTSVSISVNIVSVEVTSCGLCTGASAAPAFISANSPSGSFLPSDSQEPFTVGQTISVAIPVGGVAATKGLALAQAGYNALSSVLNGNNPASKSPCLILTGTNFARAIYGVALGLPPAIPSARCTKTTFTWSGSAPGGPLTFDIQPTAIAEDLGFGTIMSAYFGLASATVDIGPGSRGSTTTTTTTTTPATTTVPTTTTSPAGPTALAHDEGVVSGLYESCAAFTPPGQGGCQFASASTSDGAGGTLYAIEILAQYGDQYGRGAVFFFHGETLLTGTGSLSPGTSVESGSGLEWVTQTSGIQVPSPEEFAVAYIVSSGPNLCNACDGNDGTNTYVYRWNGSTMVVASGAQPTPPAVIGDGSQS